MNTIYNTRDTSRLYDVHTQNTDIDDSTDVMGGDTIKVYNAATGGKIIGKTTVSNSKTDATIKIPQLGTNAGSVYISVTSKGMTESTRTEVDYDAEAVSDDPLAENVTITNNSGKADTIYVSNLTSGDVINVYDSASGGTKLETATVGDSAAYATVASGATSATVSISQIGSTAGSVYVSLTDSNKLESDRTEADYIAEAASDSLDASNISVTNRSESADTVSITGASQNDVINVYDLAQGGTLLGTATVAASETKASISITQLGTDRGSIYVSRTSSNKSESTRVKVDYDAEPNSTAPSASNIIVTNNAGINDTVEVKGLSVGDLVQIYDSATGDTVLGSATVESNATEATVSIAQLGTATVASSAMEGTVTISQLGSSAGTVYVSVTRSGYTESSRTAVAYSAESTAPVAGNISVVNNAVISDTITVKGLTSNDIVKVYDASTSGNLIGYAIVAANSDEATVTVSQLTTGAGSVYVSVTNFGKGESKRTEVSYVAEN